MEYKELHHYLDTAWTVLNAPGVLSVEHLNEFITAAEAYEQKRKDESKGIHKLPSKLANAIKEAKNELRLREVKHDTII